MYIIEWNIYEICFNNFNHFLNNFYTKVIFTILKISFHRLKLIMYICKI